MTTETWAFNGETVMDVESNRIVVVGPWSCDIEESDGRLIAAAPDLLAAAEEAELIFDAMSKAHYAEPFVVVLRDQLRDAIAKARP